MTGTARAHYATEPDLLAKVTALLPDGPLTVEDLAPIDQFHVGGLAATTAFAPMLAAEPGRLVLDAGSGLGGPSRYIARRFGCEVRGVDLAPSYVAVAALLAERTGLGGQVTYQAGDLLALPFADGTFDAAFSQHVFMNIADRAGAYAELRRVLKPGRSFAFYDVLAADGRPEPIYPVPWAETAAASTLLTAAETQAALAAAGFATVAWEDVTAKVPAWTASQQSGGRAGGTLGTVMGPRFGAMAANLARNVREGRVRLVMASFRSA